MEDMVACHTCDYLYMDTPVPEGGVALCIHCGAALYRHKKNSIERTLVLAMCGLVIIPVTLFFPFLYFKMAGQIQGNSLISGVFEFVSYGMPMLAALVLVTSILAPIFYFGGLTVVLLHINFKRRPRWLRTLFRWVEMVAPWAMAEVFLLGVMVAVVKLARDGEVVTGVAFWAFCLLVLVTTGTIQTLDHRAVWERLEGKP